jgi:hypothetical protein
MSKMKSLRFAGLAVLVVMSLGACKSAPKPTDEQQAAPEQSAQAPIAPAAVDPELVALREKAEALRSECIAYGLNAYSKEDWERAEASRADGISSYESDVARSKASFTEAIAAYEAVIGNGLVALQSELADLAAKERQATIDCGAAAYYPEQFALADAAVADAAPLKEQGDVKGWYDSMQKALLRYRALQMGMEAVTLKRKIDKNQFEQYDAESYAQAGLKYDEAVASYGTADAAALESVTASVELYKKVSNAGYKAWSADLAQKNGEVIALCDSIKAKRALPEQYGSAAAIHAEAKKFGDSGEWESAYGSYSNSLVAFADVYQSAMLKRNSAEAAMAAAKKKQDESAALAKKADEIAPLPEGAEGFTLDSPSVSPASPTESAAAEPASEPAPSRPSDETASDDETASMSADAAVSDEAGVDEFVDVEEPATDDADVDVTDDATVDGETVDADSVEVSE